MFSWSSKKQQIIALSATEAEYIAVANSATQVLWLHRIVSILQQKQIGPTNIYCDSKLALELSKNSVLRGHSKHIDIKYHITRELVRKELQVDYCRTKEQMADIFTKALKMETFVKLTKMLDISRL